MDELKQINLTESDISASSLNTNSLMEDHVMEPVKKSKLTPSILILGSILGVIAGFFVAQKQLLLAGGGDTKVIGTQALTSSTNIKVGDIFGSADEKTFRDQAEGILMAGGIDGEGSHHIERGANITQWVYVTSSVVDLDLIVGARVTIWGETNQGKKAGWLMDVGRLKVLELNAAPTVDSSAQNE